MTIVTKFNMTVVARAIFCCNIMAWDAALPILPIYSLIYFDIHVKWRILQCGSISQFNKICTSHLFQTVGVWFRLPC